MLFSVGRFELSSNLIFCSNLRCVFFSSAILLKILLWLGIHAQKLQHRRKNVSRKLDSLSGPDSRRRRTLKRRLKLLRHCSTKAQKLLVSRFALSISQSWESRHVIEYSSGSTASATVGLKHWVESRGRVAKITVSSSNRCLHPFLVYLKHLVIQNSSEEAEKSSYLRQGKSMMLS